jgi:hypothetical protein
MIQESPVAADAVNQLTREQEQTARNYLLSRGDHDAMQV